MPYHVSDDYFNTYNILRDNGLQKDYDKGNVNVNDK